MIGCPPSLARSLHRHVCQIHQIIMAEFRLDHDGRKQSFVEMRVELQCPSHHAAKLTGKMVSSLSSSNPSCRDEDDDHADSTQRLNGCVQEDELIQ